MYRSAVIQTEGYELHFAGQWKTMLLCLDEIQYIIMDPRHHPYCEVMFTSGAFMVVKIELEQMALLLDAKPVGDIFAQAPPSMSADEARHAFPTYSDPAVGLDRITKEVMDEMVRRKKQSN